MTIKCGSGQTNGLPLLLTTTAAVVHTAPVGAATAERVRLLCSNNSGIDQSLHIAVYNSSGTLIETLSAVIPHNADLLDVLANKGRGEFVLNGTAVIKAYADDAVSLYISAVVDDQTDTAGIVSQHLASGLIAAVRNASRFAVGAMGGVGQATRANGEISMARAGILRNMRAVASTTIGGGATITVSVFVNGVASALSQTLAAADTTVAKTDTDSVAVSAGDLVTFSVACDDAGAPAANVHASVEFV